MMKVTSQQGNRIECWRTEKLFARIHYVNVIEKQYEFLGGIFPLHLPDVKDFYKTSLKALIGGKNESWYRYLQLGTMEGTSFVIQQVYDIDDGITIE